MKRKKLRLSLKKLSAAQLRQLRREHLKWRKVVQPIIDAAEASTRITGDDLKIIVRSAHD